MFVSVNISESEKKKTVARSALCTHALRKQGRRASIQSKG